MIMSNIVSAQSLTDYELQDLLLELTESEIEFAHDYLQSLKMFKATGRSVQRKYAKELASSRTEYLQNYKVQQYMEYLIIEERKRLIVTDQRIIDELAMIAFCDIREILEVDQEDNTVVIRNLAEIPYPGVIKEFKTKVIGKDRQKIFEVKLYDKMDALKMLCAMLGLSEEIQDKRKADTKTNGSNVVNHITVNHRGKNQVLEISKP